MKKVTKGPAALKLEAVWNNWKSSQRWLFRQTDQLQEQGHERDVNKEPNGQWLSSRGQASLQHATMSFICTLEDKSLFSVKDR